MKFRFSGNLLRYVDFHREVEVEGDTVEEGVRNVVRGFPAFEKVVLDSHDHIRQLHRLFLNGQLLQPTDLDHLVGRDDVIAVITPIAGG